ncbi:MAG: helix-turn-helix domain-containing protein [Burkholderiales bacterium]|nr:helix-turn-helix domain-containing protein [Burkholderiales bacterium]
MTEATDAGDAAGVGETLARARTALGFTVVDVALQLKFAPRQIEALEQERFDLLPPGMFARGMVRAYARLLKLDPQPLVERIAGRVAATDNAAVVAAAPRPIPIADSSRRGNLLYAGLSLAVLGVIAAVLIEWWRADAEAVRMKFVAPAQAPLPPAPIASPAAPRAPDPQLASLQPVAPAAAAPDAAAAARAEPAARPRPDGKRRIRMKFDRASWVEIKDRGGKTLISQLNPAGTEQEVEGRPPFDLIVGNAQHVRLSYDDRPIDLAPHVKVEVARFTLE